MDMKDRSTYKVNGTYFDDDVEAITKREEVMKHYCEELIWACHSQGLLPELVKYLRAFEKKNGIETKENNYTPLNRVPTIHHNCSFSPSAERTPKF